MQGDYWNNKFNKKKYVWGINASKLAILVIEDLKKINNTNVTILDIGCGYGRDVNYFKEHNLNALGIDNSTEAIEIGKKNGLN